MNNILVAPGEEFRFNKTLGEVSKRTGYRSAYVISNGKTVLGDGGGVCQVSTTYFRAVLDAGLQVTLRRPHSYRVSYYELNQKPGIDATVYSGDVDFRFVNDTDHHILIRSSANSDDLYMKVEIYGTSDGRTAEIVDHKTWDLRSPPPPAYYPTTEIPAGTTKQIDWAVSGIKASFTHIVKDKDGETISEKEYYSNYVPWSAKYLQGI
jgi:vancomycin resistance protein YoaR